MDMGYQNGFVIDTSAWIEFFKGSYQGEMAKEIIQNEKVKTITPSIVLGEIRKKYYEMGYDVERFYDDLRILKWYSDIVDIDEKNSIRAGEIRATINQKIPSTKKKISLIDCVLISIGKERNFKVVSTDEHFRNVDNAVYLSNQEVNSSDI